MRPTSRKMLLGTLQRNGDLGLYSHLGSWGIKTSTKNGAVRCKTDQVLFRVAVVKTSLACLKPRHSFLLPIVLWPPCCFDFT